VRRRRRRTHHPAGSSTCPCSPSSRVHYTCPCPFSCAAWASIPRAHALPACVARQRPLLRHSYFGDSMFVAIILPTGNRHFGGDWGGSWHPLTTCNTTRCCPLALPQLQASPWGLAPPWWPQHTPHSPIKWLWHSSTLLLSINSCVEDMAHLSAIMAAIDNSCVSVKGGRLKQTHVLAFSKHEG